MRGDIVYRIYGVHAGRAEDTHFGTHRTVAERELQSPEFADVAVRWSLIGDVLTATRFLKPAVRTQLQNSPKRETWCMGAGFVCCMYKGVFDAPQIEQFFAHARATLAAAS